MNIELQSPWHGNWQDRLQASLKGLGFRSLEEFLAANPGVSYVDLQQSLGSANIAAMQLYGEQIRNAAFERRLREAAMDSLVRFFREHVKRGWGQGRHFAFRLASALGDWKSVISQFAEGDRALNEQLDGVIKAINSSNPQLGWSPADKDDVIIQKAFRIGWPVNP